MNRNISVILSLQWVIMEWERYWSNISPVPVVDMKNELISCSCTIYDSRKLINLIHNNISMLLQYCDAILLAEYVSMKQRFFECQ